MLYEKSRFTFYFRYSINLPASPSPPIKSTGPPTALYRGNLEFAKVRGAR